ncbi:MAG: GNAT family N-acetyltransferase [Pseudomonadota bacterium]
MLGDGYHDLPPGKIASVVTHLQMYAPQVRGGILPDGLRFAELPRDVATYRDLFRRVGQNWLWFGRLGLKDAELDAILSDPRVHLFTLLKEDKAEALLELDFREKGACELAYFGLTPALIGTGAGAFLMDEAQRRAFAPGVTRFHVHTCTLDSPQALGFYIRSGFVPYKRQVEIADDPRQTGMLPAHVVPSLPVL